MFCQSNTHEIKVSWVSLCTHLRFLHFKNLKILYWGRNTLGDILIRDHIMYAPSQRLGASGARGYFKYKNDCGGVRLKTSLKHKGNAYFLGFLISIAYPVFFSAKY